MQVSFKQKLLKLILIGHASVNNNGELPFLFNCTLLDFANDDKLWSLHCNICKFSISLPFHVSSTNYYKTAKPENIIILHIITSQETIIFTVAAGRTSHTCN